MTTFATEWPKHREFARRYGGRCRMDRDDAEQVGAMACVEAIEKAQPGRGLSRFIRQCIRWRILEQVTHRQGNLRSMRKRHFRAEIAAGDPRGNPLLERTHSPDYDRPLDALRFVESLSPRDQQIVRSVLNGVDQQTIAREVGLGEVWLCRVLSRIRAAAMVAAGGET